MKTLEEYEKEGWLPGALFKHRYFKWPQRITNLYYDKYLNKIYVRCEDFFKYDLLIEDCELIAETTLDQCLYYAKKSIEEYYKKQDLNTSERKQLLQRSINLLYNSYVLVEWPQSQDYMEEDWFDSEAVLASVEKPSSYFIPLKRVL